MASNWFKSYNRKKFVSINGNVSHHNSIKCGVYQGSLLGPHLFLIYINDLNHTIKFCKVHHFANDTILLHFSKSVNKLNKYVNFGMKSLTDWHLMLIKSHLMLKNELVIFKHKKKKLECTIRIELSRRRLYPSNSIKYLGDKFMRIFSGKIIFTILLQN